MNGFRITLVMWSDDYHHSLAKVEYDKLKKLCIKQKKYCDVVSFVRAQIKFVYLKSFLLATCMSVLSRKNHWSTKMAFLSARAIHWNRISVGTKCGRGYQS